MAMSTGSTPPTVSDNVGSQAAHPPRQNELLCFISQKSTVMTVDDIGKICTDFYKEDEIFAAKSLLEQVLPFRLSKRQGTNKCRATVDDMIRTVLDPNIVLPVYYATDLTRIPPVDSDHCNVAAILTELQSLRAEVRAVKQLSDEVAALREEVKQLRQLKTQVAAVCQNSVPLSDIEFPSLGISDTSSQVSGSVLPESIPYAEHVKQLRASGIRPKVVKQKAKAVNKVLVGTSIGNTHLKSVQTVRTVDVFVSRLHPATVDEDLLQCVDVMKDKVNILDVTCTRLKSKYEALYASYYVAIKVDSAVLKQAVEVFMSSEVWPNGVFVKRYFRKRDG